MPSSPSAKTAIFLFFSSASDLIFAARADQQQHVMLQDGKRAARGGTFASVRGAARSACLRSTDNPRPRGRRFPDLASALQRSWLIAAPGPPRRQTGSEDRPNRIVNI
jgi:hypothetical protein